MAEKELFRLLEKGTSPFGVIQEAEQQLIEAGFLRLEYIDDWKLKPGGKYYMVHHGTAFFAFTIPAGEAKDIRMAAAHTDYPCLRIKPDPDINEAGYRKLNVEVYGGMILNTWLDRPLGISGRIALRGTDPFHPKMCTYTSKRPLLTIPNLAIHMNREVNKGIELNKQTDMLPVWGLTGEKAEEEAFLRFLAKELKVKKEEILDYELTVFCTEKPEYIGMDKELISSPRLDNLTSVQALLDGIRKGQNREGINLIAAFDHEEVGSRTKQGAGSMLLREVLDRICEKMSIAENSKQKLLYEGILLSVDVAHGLHPNKAGKTDPTNRPVLGGGFCIKEASSQSYATDCETIAVLKELCSQQEIPYQVFVNRSDMPGGSTLGAIASSFLPMRTADIGVPILAMHSARELMGKEDMNALTALVASFFTS